MSATVPLAVGAIADDFTGASDLANTLAREGLRTAQTIGVPRADADYGSLDALVVALKTRSNPAADAVGASLAALDALVARGAQRIIFKYCSTFDSTDAGNIGPVADALLARLDEPFTIVCPAFPAAGRRVFGGYLFVGDVLLSESGMRDHPITPMRDANLVRVLGRQSARRVGRIDLDVVRRGRAALAAALAQARAGGVEHAIVDATSDDDLRTLAAAALDAGLRLVTGGSGIALGLGAALRERGLRSDAAAADRLPATAGSSAIVAGSCSTATRAQVAYARERLPTCDLSEADFTEPQRVAADALAWADGALGARPILIAASASPERVGENQRRFGAFEASARVEAALAEIACGLRARGVARLVVAGGETAGAVVATLGVEALRIGPQIDAGIPWTATFGEPPLALALKSGNFGGEDFFVRAFASAP